MTNLTPDMNTTLQQIAQIIRDYKNVGITIQGFSSTTADDANNTVKDIATNRAENVYKEFLQLGAEKTKIERLPIAVGTSISNARADEFRKVVVVLKLK